LYNSDQKRMTSAEAQEDLTYEPSAAAEVCPPAEDPSPAEGSDAELALESKQPAEKEENFTDYGFLDRAVAFKEKGNALIGQGKLEAALEEYGSAQNHILVLYTDPSIVIGDNKLGQVKKLDYSIKLNTALIYLKLGYPRKCQEVIGEIAFPPKWAIPPVAIEEKARMRYAQASVAMNKLVEAERVLKLVYKRTGCSDPAALLAAQQWIETELENDYGKLVKDPHKNRHHKETSPDPAPSEHHDNPVSDEERAVRDWLGARGLEHLTSKFIDKQYVDVDAIIKVGLDDDDLDFLEINDPQHRVVLKAQHPLEVETKPREAVQEISVHDMNQWDKKEALAASMLAEEELAHFDGLTYVSSDSSLAQSNLSGVRGWLSGLGLAELGERFVEKGYDDLSAILKMGLDEEDFEWLGVQDATTQKVLRDAARAQK